MSPDLSGLLNTFKGLLKLSTKSLNNDASVMQTNMFHTHCMHAFVPATSHSHISTSEDVFGRLLPLS